MKSGKSEKMNINVRKDALFLTLILHYFSHCPFLFTLPEMYLNTFKSEIRVQIGNSALYRGFEVKLGLRGQIKDLEYHESPTDRPTS